MINLIFRLINKFINFITCSITIIISIFYFSQFLYCYNFFHNFCITNYYIINLQKYKKVFPTIIDYFIILFINIMYFFAIFYFSE
jgi:hypothetical protein